MKINIQVVGLVQLRRVYKISKLQSNQIGHYNQNNIIKLELFVKKNEKKKMLKAKREKEARPQLQREDQTKK